MLSPFDIEERLQDRNIILVAKKTGLSPQTIRALKKGGGLVATYDTMKKISDYFEQQEES